MDIRKIPLLRNLITYLHLLPPTTSKLIQKLNCSEYYTILPFYNLEKNNEIIGIKKSKTFLHWELMCLTISKV